MIGLRVRSLVRDSHVKFSVRSRVQWRREFDHRRPPQGRRKILAAGIPSRADDLTGEDRSRCAPASVTSPKPLDDNVVVIAGLAAAVHGALLLEADTCSTRPIERSASSFNRPVTGFPASDRRKPTRSRRSRPSWRTRSFSVPRQAFPVRLRLVSMRAVVLSARPAFCGHVATQHSYSL